MTFKRDSESLKASGPEEDSVVPNVLVTSPPLSGPLSSSTRKRKSSENSVLSFVSNNSFSVALNSISGTLNYSSFSSDLDKHQSEVEEGEISGEEPSSAVLSKQKKRRKQRKNRRRSSSNSSLGTFKRKKKKRKSLSKKTSFSDRNAKSATNDRNQSGKIKKSDLPRYDVRNVVHELEKTRGAPEERHRSSRRNDSRFFSHRSHLSIREQLRRRSSFERQQKEDEDEKNDNGSKSKYLFSRTKRKSKDFSRRKSKRKSSEKPSSSSPTLPSPSSTCIHSSSSVSKKEVFTAGDKIMISVNFKKKSIIHSKGETEGGPITVIDVSSSPYNVIEPSPQETIDIFSDEEKEISLEENVIFVEAHRGPCTPPRQEEVQEISINVSKGPQTPSLESYDPSEPTVSPSEGDGTIGLNWNFSDFHNKNPDEKSSKNDSSQQEKNDFKDSSSSSFSLYHLPKENEEQKEQNDSKGEEREVEANAMEENHNNTLSESYAELNIESSPCSPQSSELSEFFEPPSNSSIHSNNNNTQSKKLVKTSRKKRGSNDYHSKAVTMKIIDDKLRIVDEVPTSAVEMAVKEKFLKKVQRQERIVDEIKMVLKPFYNRKKIDKEAYKNILRKCVPKVCHSKNGEINPVKIEKLVNGYIKKFKKHKRK